MCVSQIGMPMLDSTTIHVDENGFSQVQSWPLGAFQTEPVNEIFFLSRWTF